MRTMTLATVTVALVASWLFLLPSPAAWSGPLRDGKWWEIPRISEQLGLTREQTERINEIWTDHQKQLIDTRGEIEKAYLDLENLLGKTTVDTQHAYQVAERLGQLHAKQAEQRLKMTIDTRQVLSVEQFEKLKGMRAAWEKMLREKRVKDPRKGPRIPD
jgi:Spy/CpxP family protein refolding chaperone